MPASTLPLPSRVGIIGCGAVVKRFHLPVLAAVPSLKVTCLVDKDLSRASELARRYAVPHCAQDYREIFRHIDAAIIAVPAYLTAPIAVDLLQSGKAIFLEKPMSTRLSDSQAIVDAANAAGSKVSVGFVRRYSSTIQFAREILRSGALGRIQNVSLEDGYVFDWQASSEFRFDKHRGGGILFDIGSHVLDLLRYWFAEVQIDSYEDDNCGGVPTNARLQGRSAEGVPFSVELSWTRTLRNSFVFEGERGRIEGGWYDQNAMLELGTELGTERAKMVGQTSALHCPRSKMSFPQMFFAQFISWGNALQGASDDNLGTLDDGHRNVELLEQCSEIRQAYAIPWHHLRQIR